MRSLVVYKKVLSLERKVYGHKIRIKLYEGGVFKYSMNVRGERRVITKGRYEVPDTGLIILVFKDRRIGFDYFYRYGIFRHDTIQVISLKKACLVVQDTCSSIRFRVRYCVRKSVMFKSY